MTYDVAIIGGGISGLTAAYDLQRQGHKVIVLERQQMVGGNAISQRIDGFLMEHGPTTLNAMVPQAKHLANDLGIQSQQVELGEGIAKRYLLDGKKLHGIKIKPSGFLTSPYLSIKGRLTLLTEMFRTAHCCKIEETIHAFATRRFGKEFADKVMDPLAAGMFGGSANELSMQACFPTLLEMEKAHGSITKGVLSARRGSEPSKRLFSFRNGIGTLPHALALSLKDSIKTGVMVKRINKTQSGFSVVTHKHGTITARCVVMAVQPHVASQLLELLDRPSADVTAQIDAPAMSVVFLAYKRQQVEHKLDSLGFMSVKNDRNIITGAQFFSTMFENRAPKGFVSIAAYVGGARNRDLARQPADDLISGVQRELSSILQIKGEPVLSRCRQWARSLPQYNLGHLERVKTLQSLNQRQPGLFLTGNYLTGVSVANCIGQARSVAGEVGAYLKQSTPAKTADVLKVAGK